MAEAERGDCVRRIALGDDVRPEIVRGGEDEEENDVEEDEEEEEDSGGERDFCRRRDLGEDERGGDFGAALWGDAAGAFGGRPTLLLLLVSPSQSSSCIPGGCVVTLSVRNCPPLLGDRPFPLVLGMACSDRARRRSFPL